MKKSHFVFSILFLISLLVHGQAPNPTISVNPTVICTGQTATFTAKTGTLVPLSYTWSVSPSSGFNQVSGNADSTFVINFPNAGRFVISMTWEFDVLGSATRTIAVNINKTATSAFNASLTAYGFPNEVKLTDYSINSNKIYWVFDNDFANKDSSLQTSRAYSAAGTFTVLHIAIGGRGCNDSSTYQFSLGALSVLELPNVFTPNGDDVNDIYRPKMDGISSLSVQIYNRFGIQVAAWETVNGFWDGRTLSGNACDDGTYFVIAEGKGFDGKIHSLRGTITLIR